MSSIKRGFTLVELLVVIAMIGILSATVSTSMAAAQERARVRKAEAEVKAVTIAVLGYENHDAKFTLPTMSNQECDSSSLGFLLGNAGTSSTGQKIPALLMAALSSGGKMRDPWGTPYRITIRKGTTRLSPTVASGAMSTRYTLPNLNRLTREERK